MKKPIPLGRAVIRLKCVLWKSDPDFIELWIGALTMAFGFYLLLPVKTFNSIGIYIILGKVMPETSWGIVFLTIGLVKIICLLMGTYSERRVAIMIMALLWAFVTASILTVWDDHSYSAAPLIFVFITIAVVWAFVRVGIQKTIRENLYGNGSSRSE